MTRVLSFFVVPFLGFAAAACSSSPPSSGGPITDIPPPPANVSFSTSIEPLFQSSCGTSQAICHGSTTDTTMQQPRPFLGQPFGTPSAQTLQMIHDGIVSIKSNENPTMNYITPGDINQSYLWFKVTAQQDSLTKNCTSAAVAGCGLAMPFQAAALSPAELSLIEGWIEQGALNN